MRPATNALAALCSLLLLLLLTDPGARAFDCPAKFCDGAVCRPPASCPEGQLFRANASFCGCCGECIRALPIHADCTTVLNELNIGAGVTHACDRGLLCDPILQRCVAFKPEEIPLRRCYRGLCACVAPDGRMMVAYKVPQRFSLGQTCLCARATYKTSRRHLRCDASGSFEPMQCDEKVCFCADRFGKRIADSPTIEAPRGFELQCPSHKLFA